jgi:hypothetical protein
VGEDQLAAAGGEAIEVDRLVDQRAHVADAAGPRAGVLGSSDSAS